MKKIFLLSFCLSALFSCSSEDQNLAVISASVSNLENESMTLYSYNWKEVKKLVLNNGSFSDTIIHPEGKYYLTSGEDFAVPVYLSKGYNLHLSFDKQNPNDISFSGKGALSNEYLVAKNKEDAIFRMQSTAIYRLEEQPFLEKIAEYSNKLTNDLKKVTDDAEFVNKQEKEIEFTAILYKDSYEKLHGNLIGNSEFKVSENFPQPLKDINLNNEEDFKEIEAYKALVINHFFNDVEKISSLENKPAKEVATEKLASMKEGDIRDFLINITIQWIGEYNETTAELYQKLIELLKNQEEKTKIENLIASFKKLEAGKTSPIFSDLEAIDGKTYSLSDFKGKFVYIDIWATWCGPCRKEIPHLKELEKEYKNKNIVFVSISLDKDKDAWKKMVTEQNLSGIQLHEDKSNSAFTSAYQVNTIPRFILIGKQGEIISSDAPAPSDKEQLKQLFNKNGI